MTKPPENGNDGGPIEALRSLPEAARNLGGDISDTVADQLRELRKLIESVQSDVRRVADQLERTVRERTGLGRSASVEKAPAKKTAAKKAPAKKTAAKKTAAKKAPATTAPVKR